MHSEEFENKILTLQPMAYRYALGLLGNPEEAKDIVQETVLKLWLNRQNLDHINSIRSFTLTMTKNLCFDRLKSKAMNISKIDFMDAVIADETQHQRADLKETFHVIQHLMGRLDKQERSVIQLRGIEELSMEEIAAIMNTNVKHARVILSRARKNLKEMYQDYYHHGKRNNG